MPSIVHNTVEIMATMKMHLDSKTIHTIHSKNIEHIDAQHAHVHVHMAFTLFSSIEMHSQQLKWVDSCRCCWMKEQTVTMICNLEGVFFFFLSTLRLSVILLQWMPNSIYLLYFKMNAVDLYNCWSNFSVQFEKPTELTNVKHCKTEHSSPDSNGWMDSIRFGADIMA